jgi:hypothetical protein
VAEGRLADLARRLGAVLDHRGWLIAPGFNVVFCLVSCVVAPIFARHGR